ncbi:MAG: MFS transporter [Propioniciclava sp.]|uniref:MFS transporter n=1 Tax=Propioniciclava sp. TaxID=2038686 RepID=UPI0039E36A94
MTPEPATAAARPALGAGSVPDSEPAPATARRSSASTKGRVSSTVVSLGVVSLMTDISSEAVAAILPLYMTAALGLSTVAYGFVDGILQGASSLVRIAAGWAADKGGRPKWVAFAGYFLSMLTRVGLLLFTSAGAMVALITADRIGKGIRTSPRDALIAASSTPRTIGRSFGVHRALDTAGAALGPLLAFVILWLIPDGYGTVFVVSLGAAVIGVAVLLLMVPDLQPRRASWLAKHRDRQERKLPKCKGCSCDAPGLELVSGPRFSWSFLRDPAMRRTIVVAGVLALLTVGDGFIYLSLLERDGFAAQWFPLLYVGTNAFYMALAVPFGQLADRFGRTRVFVAGHLALLLAYLGAAVPGSWLLSLGVLALLGAFYAATDGVLAALAGAMVAPQVRASAIGTVQTAVAVGRLLSSVAFGLLWYTLGRGEALMTVAVLLALAVPVGYLLLRRFAHAVYDPAESQDTAPSFARPDANA